MVLMTSTTAYRAARGFDRAVNGAIVLAIACALLFSGYSLWDSWRVLHAPDEVNARLMEYMGPNGPSFRELLALNPDVVAWLRLDGTHIDYPVVQGEDDFEYLNKDVFGEFAPSGSIFLGKGAARDFSDPYSVVMGHHMAESKMFGDLDLYRDEGFFQANTTGTLWLPDRTLQLETVALLSADAYDGALYNLPVTSDGMARVISRIEGLSVHSRGGALRPTDQLIALSTCASGSANERTVLVCRVVGETAASNNE